MSGSRVDMKIVLLGKEYGGKTSLVERYLHGRFAGETPYQNVSIHQGYHRQFHFDLCFSSHCHSCLLDYWRCGLLRLNKLSKKTKLMSP